MTVSLEVDKNLSKPTFTCLIVIVIIKTLYIVFFLPAYFDFFSLATDNFLFLLLFFFYRTIYSLPLITVNNDN